MDRKLEAKKVNYSYVRGLLIGMLVLFFILAISINSLQVMSFLDKNSDIVWKGVLIAVGIFIALLIWNYFQKEAIVHYLEKE